MAGGRCHSVTGGEVVYENVNDCHACADMVDARECRGFWSDFIVIVGIRLS